MKTIATRRSPTVVCATPPVPTRRCIHGHSRVEALEARIAPATLAALPGNANFEDTLDFGHWTVNAGPLSTFTEYLTANVETTVVRGGLAPEGDAYAHLSFQGRVDPTTTGFGPSLQSETFTASAGEQISVVWRATNNGDTAHPRGRLFDSMGVPVATFFDSDTGTTAFATATVTVPSAGQYYLLFEAGASDVTVGGQIGAKLDIDAIHRSPHGVATTMLMNGQLSVDISADRTPTPGNPNQFRIALDDTGQFVEIFANDSLDFVQPLSAIDRINVMGLFGLAQLTVDSTNGLIALAEGIHFDGGGTSDLLSLVQTGGATRLTDVFTVGANAGEGTSAIGDGMKSQIVYFKNVEPVLDNVPATSFSVVGTEADNAISSAVGTGGGIFTGATGKVTVDGSDSIEFNNKTSLTISSLGGSDTISLNHPTKPAGLSAIAVDGAGPATAPGDTLRYLTAGAIHPSVAGAGTITETGLPSVSFIGIEIASVAGVTVTPGMTGASVTATGDQASAGQDDSFAIVNNAATQYLTLALNGSIALYAHQAAIAQINVNGVSGTDSLMLTGTNAAETLTFTPTAVDAGSATIVGNVIAGYTAIDLVILNGSGGDDAFAIGGSLGAARVIGGTGSDRLDFSAASARIVFDLDAIGVDQYVNTSGQNVSLGDVIENFTGSAFNDTLKVNAANFARDLKGGADTHEVFPPGDELSFDGQGQVVTTTLVNSSSGTYQTRGFTDVTFEGFETPLIANSPSGPGFGTPESNNAFETAHIYNLLTATSGGKPAPGRVPTAVATGDLNGDGFIDIVAVNSSSGTIGVLLNIGDGTFAAPISYKTGGRSPQDIAIGNFDATPGLDLAVTNRASATLAILSGDNLGGFAAPTLIKTASSPSAITVGRVNGDGLDDLVIAHSALNKISLLLGTGAGFGQATVFKTIGARPVDVIVGDFNGDGKTDVATANLFSNNVSFFSGDGSGGLAAPTLFATGSRPTSLAGADYNLDGFTDLAVSHQVSRFVSILFSNGAVPAATQFQPQLQVALAGKHSPTAILAADFNGDGIADLGLANSVGTNFTVLIGSNLGRFSQPYEFDLGKFRPTPRTGSLAIADFNNDGLLDVVTTGYFSADVRVLLRKG